MADRRGPALQRQRLGGFGVGRVLAETLALPAQQRAQRLTQLAVGLVLYGVSIALMVSAGLGVDPWDVLHQGISNRTGISMGWIIIAASAVVLALWVPLHQRPGIGTVSNAIVVGLALDAALAVLPQPEALPPRVAYLIVGIVGNGLATGLYIGAGLGPGPRDGLMIGLARRGHSLRFVRTSIEVTVLSVGWLLGGNVGIGTVLYAASIGPLAQYFLTKLTATSAREPPPTAPSSARPSARAPRGSACRT